MVWYPSLPLQRSDEAQFLLGLYRVQAGAAVTGWACPSGGDRICPNLREGGDIPSLLSWMSCELAIFVCVCVCVV